MIKRYFYSALRAEFSQLRCDRGGHVILLALFVGMVVWSAGLTYLSARYLGEQSTPSERICVSGLFQIGIYGLFIWCCRSILLEVLNGFHKQKLLYLHDSKIIFAAKCFWLILVGLIFSLLCCILTSVISLFILRFTFGPEISTLYIGRPLDYINLAGQISLVTIGSVAFSSGIALILKDLGAAIACTFIWTFIIEGMISSPTESSEIVYTLLPFKNAFRMYENLPDEYFLWNQLASILYFIAFCLGILFIGIFLARRR